jgi:hypothetical protein
MSCYRFIAAERAHYPVRRLCQVLGVPASGFYAWQADEQRAVGHAKAPAWETALVRVFGVHRRRYGTRRLQVAIPGARPQRALNIKKHGTNSPVGNFPQPSATDVCATKSWLGKPPQPPSQMMA